MQKDYFEITDNMINIDERKKYAKDKENQIHKQEEIIQELSERISNLEKEEMDNNDDRKTDKLVRSIKINERLLKKHKETLKRLNERKAEEYIIPDMAVTYTIDIENQNFNIYSYYSFCLVDGDSLESFSSLDWKVKIYNGRVRIIAQSDSEPDHDLSFDSYGADGIVAIPKRIKNPAGKVVCYFYQNHGRS